MSDAMKYMGMTGGVGLLQGHLDAVEAERDQLQAENARLAGELHAARDALPELQQFRDECEAETDKLLDENAALAAELARVKSAARELATAVREQDGRNGIVWLGTVLYAALAAVETLVQEPS